MNDKDIQVIDFGFDHQAAQAQDELEKKEQLVEALKLLHAHSYDACGVDVSGEELGVTEAVMLIASALGLKKEFEDLVG